MLSNGQTLRGQRRFKLLLNKGYKEEILLTKDQIASLVATKSDPESGYMESELAYMSESEFAEVLSE